MHRPFIVLALGASMFVFAQNSWRVCPLVVVRLRGWALLQGVCTIDSLANGYVTSRPAVYRTPIRSKRPRLYAPHDFDKSIFYHCAPPWLDAPTRCVCTIDNLANGYVTSRPVVYRTPTSGADGRGYTLHTTLTSKSFY
ncbi:hypothetical protein RSAG8_07519, partial [Rhizoctonia solani AG-8 WAC10335]